MYNLYSNGRQIGRTNNLKIAKEWVELKVGNTYAIDFIKVRKNR